MGVCVCMYVKGMKIDERRSKNEGTMTDRRWYSDAAADEQSKRPAITVAIFAYHKANKFLISRAAQKISSNFLSGKVEKHSSTTTIITTFPTKEE